MTVSFGCKAIIFGFCWSCGVDGLDYTLLALAIHYVYIRDMEYRTVAKFSDSGRLNLRENTDMRFLVSAAEAPPTLWYRVQISQSF